MSRRFIFSLAALATFLMFAAPLRSQNGPPPSSPHASSPPNSQAQPAPPETPQPQSNTEQNRRIHDSISDLLSSDPVLSGSDVDAAVDDHNIVLTGKVQGHVQHERVLQLVSSYGRWRKIVDKIQ
jgi:pyruvate/2-oxoglutarate dehydrogenase complex dihydrolipoamide acyltransferase (E2) component